MAIDLCPISPGVVLPKGRQATLVVKQGISTRQVDYMLSQKALSDQGMPLLRVFPAVFPAKIK